MGLYYHLHHNLQQSLFQAFLSGGAERNEFALFDFIALRLHEPQEVVKVFGLRDGRVDGDFQFGFPALALALGVPFGVGLALVLARLHHGQAVFLAQPVTGSPDIGVAAAGWKCTCAGCTISTAQKMM